MSPGPTLRLFAFKPRRRTDRDETRGSATSDPRAIRNRSWTLVPIGMARPAMQKGLFSYVRNRTYAGPSKGRIRCPQEPSKRRILRPSRSGSSAAKRSRGIRPPRQGLASPGRDPFDSANRDFECRESPSHEAGAFPFGSPNNVPFIALRSSQPGNHSGKLYLKRSSWRLRSRPIGWAMRPTSPKRSRVPVTPLTALEMELPS